MIQSVTAIKNVTNFPLDACHSAPLAFRCMEILSLLTLQFRSTIWNDVQVFIHVSGFPLKLPTDAVLLHNIGWIMALSNGSTHAHPSFQWFVVCLSLSWLIVIAFKNSLFCQFS